jgi:MFS superfamily sulfate permease-like transporter
VAVVVATVVTVSLGLSINQVALPERLLSAVTLPSLPSASLLANWQSLLIAVVSIAFIASAETLLSASAVDQMHTGPRTNYDRELLAQGVGNLTCGFLGALPVTGVIVRSATNVDAGARSSKSEILHSVWLLVFVCIFPFVLRWIPTASLAAILVYTGCKLVDLKTVREKLLPFGKSEVAIYVATMVLIVATDLLTGVLIGMALSIIKLVVTFSHLNIRADDHPQNRRTVLYLEGTATFLRLPKLAAALDAVPLDRELHVHFERLEYIDHACLDLLMARQKQLGATGGGLVIDWESLTARFHDYGKNHRRNGPGPASPANGQENGKRTNQDGGNSRTREESQHAV